MYVEKWTLWRAQFFCGEVENGVCRKVMRLSLIGKTGNSEHLFLMTTERILKFFLKPAEYLPEIYAWGTSQNFFRLFSEV